MGFLLSSIKKKIYTTYTRMRRVYFEKVSFPRLKKFQISEIQRVASRKVINVGFLVIDKSIWKADEVFERLISDSRFNPAIIICPDVKLDSHQILSSLQENLDFFIDKGYEVYSTYDYKYSRWRDISEFDLDVVWFTNPHRVTKKEYYLDLCSRYLCFYLPYYFMATDHEGDMSRVYNSEFLNSMVRIFWPSDYHLSKRQQYKTVHCDNDLVTGYPAVERLICTQPEKKGGWKCQSSRKVRIIYAPHHSIGESVNSLSTFLILGKFIQSLAMQKKDKVQWCFKPHPLLRRKLELHPDWGPEKTEKYYSFWSDKCYSQIALDDYVDLFNDSDAIIHDCSSFIVEYALTGRRGVLALEDEVVKRLVNDFGKKFLDNYTITTDKNKITEFVNSMVSEKIGVSNEQKFHAYVENYYRGSLPSLRIIEELRDIFRC